LACHLFMDGTNYHKSLKKTTVPYLGFSKDLLNAPRIMDNGLRMLNAFYSNGWRSGTRHAQ